MVTCQSREGWQNSRMKVKILTSLDQIAAEQWDALVQDRNPFTSHAFLVALEHHGCVGEEFGWLPRHIAVFDGEDDSELVGAMPLYEKHNSYGEFVFDHAWSEAYKRHGLQYFPKLVSSIPYTPASGQRLLAKAGQEDAVRSTLIAAMLRLAEDMQASSFHCLFPVAEEQDWLEEAGFIPRHDCQFHWRNFDYQSFDDFLATLSAKKRKNIRQERRKVNDAKVKLRQLDGHTATDEDWEQFAFFYKHTFEEKWGIPTLNAGFFKQVAANIPDQVLLVLADDEDGECIAGSLMFRSDTRLYGRHWGCTEHIDCLHFEACYYQGIEYCIEHGLQVFEPGAQGEHKIPRGFIPTLTRSSHWLASDAFRQPIERHVEQERGAVAYYMENVRAHSPYKDGFLEEKTGQANVGSSRPVK